MQFMQVVSWAGVAGIFVWKILVPFTDLLIRKVNGRDDNSKLCKRVEKIENNHLEAIRGDIVDLKRDVREVKLEQSRTGERLARIETKVSNRRGT